jgi:ubiquinone biosynthesis protein
MIKLFRLLSILSKNQLLTHPGDIKLPFSFKILGWICCFFLSPKSLFIRPKNNFGKRFTDCLYQLGPIYIKLGQTLSVRPDLIGPEIAEQLKLLQDKLPAFDSKIARAAIEKNFQQPIEEIFEDFEDAPVASASIAQVHKAKLLSGEMVAVKILRPNIIKKYNEDICFLEYAAKISLILSKKIRRLKPKEVISIFRKSMIHELDLQQEAAAASRISDDATHDDILYVPKIYWQYTNHNILTNEWINGVSIYETDKIMKFGLDPKEIAAKVAVIFFNQAFRDGFFHADLHPGNILVKQDGNIALVDFGIIGALEEKDRLAIAEILYAFLKRDYALVAKIHHRIGYIPLHTDLNDFAQSCRSIAEPILDLAAKDISIGNLLAQLFKVTEKFGMETQPQLLLLQKTMVVVEGIGQSLDPEINMWSLAEPWMKKWAIKNISPEAKFVRFIKKIFSNLCE